MYIFLQLDKKNYGNERVSNDVDNGHEIDHLVRKPEFSDSEES